MKISSMVVLIAVSCGSSAAVLADSRQQQTQISATGHGGHSQLSASRSFRYQDPVFSISYRYSDWDWTRHQRHRHQQPGFDRHRHAPKYGPKHSRSRRSAQRFDDYHRHHNSDRYPSIIRPRLFNNWHFNSRRPDRRH